MSGIEIRGKFRPVIRKSGVFASQKKEKLKGKDNIKVTTRKIKQTWVRVKKKAPTG